MTVVVAQGVWLRVKDKKKHPKSSSDSPEEENFSRIFEEGVCQLHRACPGEGATKKSR